VHCLFTQQAEVGAPVREHPDCGRLQATVEMSSCASPEYEVSLSTVCFCDVTLRRFLTTWPAFRLHETPFYLDVQGRGGELWGLQLAQALESSLVPEHPEKGARQMCQGWCKTG